MSGAVDILADAGLVLGAVAFATAALAAISGLAVSLRRRQPQAG